MMAKEKSEDGAPAPTPPPAPEPARPTAPAAAGTVRVRPDAGGADVSAGAQAGRTVVINLLGVGGRSGLHTPTFKPDERVLTLAPALFATAALTYLGSGR